MKILASILHRPMAFLFLLLFISGCIFLISFSQKDVHNVGLQDDVTQKKNVAKSEIHTDRFTKDSVKAKESIQSKQKENEAAVGGPEQPMHIPEVEYADSGDATAQYVVVSEKVEDAGDCTKYEKYDQVKDICFFECNTPKQCDQIESMVNAELASVEESFGDFFDVLHMQKIEVNQESILAHYVVEEDEWIELKEGVKEQEHNDIWLAFAAISPDEISNKYIASFIVYNDAKSDTAAFVQQDSTDESKWELYINIDAIKSETKREKNILFIHEFAHIMTLNDGQVDPTVDESVCTQFWTGEGCAQSDSYINKFYNTFWSETDLIQIDALEDDQENPLYKKNPDHFLSAYAATNPGEDIAESFTAFIFTQKPVEKDAIKDQKIQFFYEFADLVAFREILRESFGLQRVFERR